MAVFNSQNRRPLTKRELQMEADNLWANEDEPDSGEDIFGQLSDDDEDYITEQSGSDTGQSEDDEEGGATGPEPPRRNVASIRGKNDHRWSTEIPDRRGRTRRENIVLHLPGPRQQARGVRSPIEAWELLFNTEMLDLVVHHTNQEILRKSLEGVMQSYKKSTNVIEIKAFIGLLYLAGALRLSNSNLDEIWSIKYGNGLFRATMSQQRFQFLAVCLRFDDKNDRDARKLVDKFTHIRQLWDIFISNCKSHYTPYENCTVDEQLVGFRGRCPFRIYMASKPDKYGIKVMMLNDSKTFYMLNAIPYVGKVTVENNEPVPTYYVRKLTEPIHGTHRNVTMDNWFTSIPLSEQMLQQYELTILGTLRKNKREIPPSFLAKKETGTSLFAFDHNKTLVSFTPKENKIVLLLSTLHPDSSIHPDTGKPNLIHTYNETKGGTDTFDQLCHSYTTSRKTRRWPLRFFFNMLDAAGINAMVLFSLANPEWKEDSKNNRKTFIKELSNSLIEPHLRDRVQVPSLQRSLRLSICQILEIAVEVHQEPNFGVNLPRKVRCALCPRGKDRKTNFACSICHRPYCLEHRARLCCECELQN